MKRFRRILFNTLTAISLVLASATAGLWVRSGFASDCVYVQWVQQGERYVESRSAFFSIYRGRFVAHYTWQHAGRDGGKRLGEAAQWGYYVEAPEDLGPLVRWWWVYYERYTPGKFMSDSPHLEMSVPFWMLVLLAGAVPCMSLISALRLKCRMRAGHCPACGYDMRANPSRCSECGHEPKPVTT